MQRCARCTLAATCRYSKQQLRNCHLQAHFAAQYQLVRPILLPQAHHLKCNLQFSGRGRSARLRSAALRATPCKRNLQRSTLLQLRPSNSDPRPCAATRSQFSGCAQTASAICTAATVRHLQTQLVAQYLVAAGPHHLQTQLAVQFSGWRARQMQCNLRCSKLQQRNTARNAALRATPCKHNLHSFIVVAASVQCNLASARRELRATSKV